MKNNVPTFDELINPCFQVLKELGGSATNDEIDNNVILKLKLSDEVLNVMQSDTDHRSKVQYRLAWARTYLKNYGAIENVARSVWSITSDFGNIEKVNAKEVVTTVRALKNKAINNETNKPISEDGNDEIPEEISLWRAKMLNILQNMNPYGFERFVQLLLRKCGIDNVQVTKKSGDGGIDGNGEYKLNGIFSFKLAFQCKRYIGTVGSSEIRDFRGSLSTDIEKALFVTTGVFSPAAKEEAKSSGKTSIDLIDGEALIDKIAELQLGVMPKTIYEIDDKFFAQYNEA